jgi:hypothetical protein
MLSALCELAGSKKRPAETEIVFAGLVDEENAQAGSRAPAASGLPADLAIADQPTASGRHRAQRRLWLGSRHAASGSGARPERGATPFMKWRGSWIGWKRVTRQDCAGTTGCWLRHGERWDHPRRRASQHCARPMRDSVDRRTLPEKPKNSVRERAKSCCVSAICRPDWQSQTCRLFAAGDKSAASAVSNCAAPASRDPPEWIILRCVGFVGRGHSQRRVRAWRHRPGSHCQRVDFARFPPRTGDAIALFTNSSLNQNHRTQSSRDASRQR